MAMSRGVQIGAAAVGSVALGAAAAAAIGARRWERETERAIERLEAASQARDARAQRYDPAELEGAPPPVRRYFAYALTPGQPLVRRALVRHAGTFRTRVDAAEGPFRSVQHVTVSPPGFVWDAHIRMAPLLQVRVRDSYIDGRGTMLGAVAGVVPVVEQEGTPELASGALHRYLAEAAWVPTALLPGQGVRWEPVDDGTARATLRDGDVEVALDVHFGDSGEIVRVEGERFRDEGGVGVRRPWVGHFRAYGEVDGMRIPMEGEVEWILPEGRLVYWRGQVEGVEYELASSRD